MLSSEELLESAARDGSLDIAEWPRVLESLLQRLHEIVYNEFPIPSLPHQNAHPSSVDPQVVASTPPRLANSDTETTEHDILDADAGIDKPTDSQSSTKENDAPTEIAAGRQTSDATNAVQSEQTSALPPGADGTVEAPAGTLPPDLLSLYQMSRRVLEHDFSDSPPYTVQRLAELVLRPKAQYRFLPAYLRALDRIVSVSSPLSNFPLATTHSPTTASFLTNGALPNGVSEREGLGSDESLGGALLTPIPWLRNNANVLVPSSNLNPSPEGELHSESTETIDGPHGAGHIETVSVTVNGVSSTTNTASSAYTSSSPIASPTLSEQSDASSSSASSTEAQLREQGGVTQGELLRQEQEAGLIPVNPPGLSMGPRRTLIAGGAAAVGREQVPMPNAAVAAGVGEPAPMDVGLDDEQPHARGPDIIGMEDMGPQRQNVEAGGGAVLDMEAAVGRGRSKSPQPPAVVLGGEATESKGDAMEGVERGEVVPSAETKEVESKLEERNAMTSEAKEDVKEEAEKKDMDGDVLLGDADGGKEEAKVVEAEAAPE